jgi:hypothetical protein
MHARTHAGLEGDLDKALALLQKHALMLQRGAIKDASDALHDEAH